MADQTWRPLSRRTGGEHEDCLHEGIPDWLRPSLASWLSAVLSERYFDQARLEWRVRWSRSHLSRLERELHVQLDWSREDAGLLDVVGKDDQVYLDTIDYLLANGTLSEHQRRDLTQILEEGGSAWRLSASGRALERRVLPGVRELVLDSQGSTGTPGFYLSQAWSAIYSRDPNPDQGYQDAVRAVEAAAKPIVLPNDSLATLGRIIGTIRSTAISFRLPLEPPSDPDPITVLLGMLELLWRGQRHRHGTSNHDQPVTASQKEAECALHLAGTLVHWFSSGAVVRIDRDA